MSQGKKDKFLAGYFIGLGVIVAGLGYLAYSASDATAAAKSAYDSANTRLETLQKRKLFPNQEHATEKAKRVGDYVASVHEALKNLQQYQQPVDETAKNDAFQAKLTSFSTALKEDADGRKVKLPKEFDFGFSAYKSSQPSPEAAPMLTVQLEALNFLATTALSCGVTAIDTFKRGELAVEKEKPVEVKADPKVKKTTAKPPVRAAQGQGKGAAKSGPAAPVALAIEESKVLERIPVELAISGNQKSISEFLVALANTGPDKQQPYFFITRAARVENQKKTGPEKSAKVNVVETPDPVTKVVVKRDLEYIIGGEPVKAHLVLDLVRFLPVEEAPASGKAAPAKSATAKPAAAKGESK